MDELRPKSAWSATQGGLRGVVVLAWLSSTGCVIVEEEAPPGPCDRVACSENGYCEAGKCSCKPGYLGDPYALHGCQSAVPGSHCQTTCGLNAYCSNGACRCAEGFVAVCGTGDCIPEASLCDGYQDCQNGKDEEPAVCYPAAAQEWIVVDDCDDGLDVEWRLWSEDGTWVWPNIEEVFMTAGLGARVTESIECLEGETVCLGAAAEGASGHRWGVGIDGEMSCDGCCFRCEAGSIDYGALLCPR